MKIEATDACWLKENPLYVPEYDANYPILKFIFGEDDDDEDMIAALTRGNVVQQVPYNYKHDRLVQDGIEPNPGPCSLEDLLFMLICYYASSLMLLLLSGDVETNPGPKIVRGGKGKNVSTDVVVGKAEDNKKLSKMPKGNYNYGTLHFQFVNNISDAGEYVMPVNDLRQWRTGQPVQGIVCVDSESLDANLSAYENTYVTEVFLNVQRCRECRLMINTSDIDLSKVQEAGAFGDFPETHEGYKAWVSGWEFVGFREGYGDSYVFNNVLGIGKKLYLNFLVDYEEGIKTDIVIDIIVRLGFFGKKFVSDQELTRLREEEYGCQDSCVEEGYESQHSEKD